jgi:hypothetical protein
VLAMASLSLRVVGLVPVVNTASCARISQRGIDDSLSLDQFLRPSTMNRCKEVVRSVEGPGGCARAGVQSQSKSARVCRD